MGVGGFSLSGLDRAELLQDGDLDVMWRRHQTRIEDGRVRLQVKRAQTVAQRLA